MSNFISANSNQIIKQSVSRNIATVGLHPLRDLIHIFLSLNLPSGSHLCPPHPVTTVNIWHGWWIIFYENNFCIWKK